MAIVGGVDIHRKQLTFDYLDVDTGCVERGRIVPADRAHLADWLRRFDGVDQVAFAMEGCTGWRYVAEEMRTAGVAPHLAEPADTSMLRGPKRRAKTDKADALLLRQLLTDGAGAENLIRPAQAACSYSCMRPPRRSRRWMRTRAIVAGSVIGWGSGRSGRALAMPRWGRQPL